jgi:hypothetical protein
MSASSSAQLMPRLRLDLSAGAAAGGGGDEIKHKERAAPVPVFVPEPVAVSVPAAFCAEAEHGLVQIPLPGIMKVHCRSMSGMNGWTQELDFRELGSVIGDRSPDQMAHQAHQVVTFDQVPGASQYWFHCRWLVSSENTLLRHLRRTNTALECISVAQSRNDIDCVDPTLYIAEESCLISSRMAANKPPLEAPTHALLDTGPQVLPNRTSAVELRVVVVQVVDSSKKQAMLEQFRTPKRADNTQTFLTPQQARAAGYVHPWPVSAAAKSDIIVEQASI